MRLLERLGVQVRASLRGLEDRWFDATRRVATSGDKGRPAAEDVVGEIHGSHVYAPVRVANARAALRALPVGDFSQYSFIDMGSGKARMLFVAAELPFPRVIGVEFDRKLHAAAKENIARRRNWR